MTMLKNLQPERVFYFFEEICKIPHASYNTKPMGDYLEGFAKEKGLNYYRDEHDNVVIYKGAAPGYEKASPVIIQGHSDMVAEREADSTHDFDTQPLKLVVDGDMMKALGTTLGGDDGIAVAYALAILEDSGLPHPALEVVITSNEEVGLLGATALDTSVLSGTRMINIDSDEEGILLAGCAGGLSALSDIPMEYVQETGIPCEIVIHGLKGGHSGIEIHKNRGNANMLMGRLLHMLDGQFPLQIAELSGGQKDNVITPAATALLVMEEDNIPELKELCAEFESMLTNEYLNIEEQINVSIQVKEEASLPVLHPVSREKAVFFLMNLPAGVDKMSGSIVGLVETSYNPGVVRLDAEKLHVTGGLRSSIESAKWAFSEKLCYLTEFLGGEYQVSGVYPAWEYKEESKLREIMTEAYQDLFHKEMKVEVIHAGLECGIFYDKIPDLDCVSFGPEMADIHSTKERMSISSVKRMWDYLLHILALLKE